MVKCIKGDINIRNLKKIKSMRNRRHIFVCDDGKEGVILAKKYGPEWWKRAKVSDLKRIVVH